MCDDLPTLVTPEIERPKASERQRDVGHGHRDRIVQAPTRELVQEHRRRQPVVLLPGLQRAFEPIIEVVAQPPLHSLVAVAFRPQSITQEPDLGPGHADLYPIGPIGQRRRHLAHASRVQHQQLLQCPIAAMRRHQRDHGRRERARLEQRLLVRVLHRVGCEHPDELAREPKPLLVPRLVVWRLHRRDAVQRQIHAEPRQRRLVLGVQRQRGDVHLLGRLRRGRERTERRQDRDEGQCDECRAHEAAYLACAPSAATSSCRTLRWARPRGPTAMPHKQRGRHLAALSHTFTSVGGVPPPELQRYCLHFSWLGSRMKNCTRRFFWRPAGVTLVSIGFSSP